MAELGSAGSLLVTSPSSSSSSWSPSTASPSFRGSDRRHVLSTPTTSTSRSPPRSPQQLSVSGCPRGLASLTHSICVISRRLPRSRFAPPANVAENFINAATPPSCCPDGKQTGPKTCSDTEQCSSAGGESAARLAFQRADVVKTTCLSSFEHVEHGFSWFGCC